MEISYIEICNHCGLSVAYGDGLFVDRIPDGNDIFTRIENDWLFPLGDFVCRICDATTSDDDVWGNLN